MARSHSPSLEALKKAIALAEQIQRLEADLARLLAGTGPVLVEGAKRRGRPPKAEASVVRDKKLKVRKKRTMSEEGRQRIIEAQKKRWAARKKNS